MDDRRKGKNEGIKFVQGFRNMMTTHNGEMKRGMSGKYSPVERVLSLRRL